MTGVNAYNVDKKIDYFTVRSMVMRSLEKIFREELNRHSSQRRVNLNKTEEDEVVIADTNHLFDDDTILCPSLLKLTYMLACILAQH